MVSESNFCQGYPNATLLDHDPIQACILSVATNHSAEAESITRPHVGAQRELIDQVLREAGVCGRSIGYAEMHGTGTQVCTHETSMSTLDTDLFTH